MSQQEIETLTEYSAEIDLPFGEVEPHSILCFTPNKDNKDEEIKPKITITPINQELEKQIKNEKSPMPISQVNILKNHFSD